MIHQSIIRNLQRDASYFKHALKSQRKLSAFECREAFALLVYPLKIAHSVFLDMRVLECGGICVGSQIAGQAYGGPDVEDDRETWMAG